MRMEAGDAWEEHGLIFTNQTGGYLSYRTVYDCFKRIVRNIGAPATRFYDLRHTFAVASIKSGDDIKTVQENLGHATAAFTLDVYGHVTKQMKQDSAARMEQFIKSVSGARGTIRLKIRLNRVSGQQKSLEVTETSRLFSWCAVQDSNL